MEMDAPQNVATVEDIQRALAQWQDAQDRIGRAKDGTASAESVALGAAATDAPDILAMEDQAKAAWTTVLQGMGKSLRPRVLYTPY